MVWTRLYASQGRVVYEYHWGARHTAGSCPALPAASSCTPQIRAGFMPTSPSHLQATARLVSTFVSPSRYARCHSGAIAVLLAASSLCCSDDDQVDLSAASEIQIIAGDGQHGRVSQVLPEPLVVGVFDESGSPVTGVSVAWAAQGGGSVDPETVATDSDGHASVRRILGPSAGEQTTTAAVSGLQSSPATFTSTTIDEEGPPSPP